MNHRRLKIGAAAAAALLACSAGAMAQNQSVEGTWRESMRTSMGRWVEAEKLISSERNAWKLDRELLEYRYAALTNETAALRSATAGINDDYEASAGKCAEYVEEDAKLKALSEVLAEEVAAAEKSVLAILEKAPGPIVEKVRPLSQRIPLDPSTSKAGLGERLQNVVGVLNEINKFSRDITVVSEVMTPEGSDTSFEASVVYFGLGQGYYVNQPGTVAGYGWAGDEGWVWMPSNSIAQAVADVVKIHATEKPAEYVVLPVSIK